MVSCYEINLNEVKNKKLRNYLERNKMNHIFECNNEKIYFSFLNGEELKNLGYFSNYNQKPRKENPKKIKEILNTFKEEKEKKIDFHDSGKFISGAKLKEIEGRKFMSRSSALIVNGVSEDEILLEILCFLFAGGGTEIPDILLCLEEEGLAYALKR